MRFGVVVAILQPWEKNQENYRTYPSSDLNESLALLKREKSIPLVGPHLVRHAFLATKSTSPERALSIPQSMEVWHSSSHVRRSLEGCALLVSLGWNSQSKLLASLSSDSLSFCAALLHSTGPPPPSPPLLTKAPQHKPLILADFYERSGTKKGQYKCTTGINLLFNIRNCCPNILAIPATGKLSQVLPPLGRLTPSPYRELFLRDLFSRVETISVHSLLNKCRVCACMHTHNKVLVGEYT